LTESGRRVGDQRILIPSLRVGPLLMKVGATQKLSRSPAEARLNPGIVWALVQANQRGD